MRMTKCPSGLLARVTGLSDTYQQKVNILRLMAVKGDKSRISEADGHLWHYVNLQVSTYK